MFVLKLEGALQQRTLYCVNFTQPCKYSVCLHLNRFSFFNSNLNLQRVQEKHFVVLVCC